MENTALKMFTDTVKVESGQIFVKPLCDFFGIDYRNQVSKIKNSPEMASQIGKNRSEMLFSDTRHHLSLTKNGFLMWILSINPLTIREELRDNFIRYKSLISDYLYGSAEEQENIRNLNARLQQLKNRNRETRREIRVTQGKLTDALNQRYQYEIDFTENSQLDQ